jgi:hypothetical protein
MSPEDIARLRQDLEAFQGELMLEFYSNHAGLKDEMATVGIYDRYAHLFSREAIDAASKAEEDESPEEARKARYLRAFSTFGYMDAAVKQLTDRANTIEAQSVVEFDGEGIPYRHVPLRLRTEAEHARRAALFDAKLAETAKLNAVLVERVQTLHETAKELGARDYADLCSRVKGIDYLALETDMEELIHRTEHIYEDHMSALFQERAGLSLEDAWSYDIPFAFKGNEFDADFSKERLAEAFFATLKTLGMDRAAYGNIMIDTEERPRKTPRAFCAPVKVPDDIRLVIMPIGGWKDYQAFFHEGGHAWHFGSVRQDLPLEYRYLGDNSVTEAFAFLFEHLVTDPLWLEKSLGMRDSGAFVRFALLNKLMFLRRYACKLMYELKLHHGHGPVTHDFEEVYRTCLQRGLRFKHTGKHFLEDVDDSFYCAEYLRAWVLDAQLREALREKFGDAWFLEERAGKYLREMWSYGQKYNADELVKTVGFVELDHGPLLSELERGLEG